MSLRVALPNMSTSPIYDISSRFLFESTVLFYYSQPRWLSGLRRSLADDCSPLCPEKLGSNPGQGSKWINLSGWHGLDMSVTVTKGLQQTNRRVP